MLDVYKSQTASISVPGKRIEGGLAREDGEALSADTHAHPTGQEVALAATEEPGISDWDGTWRWANTYNGDSLVASPAVDGISPSLSPAVVKGFRECCDPTVGLFSSLPLIPIAQPSWQPAEQASRSCTGTEVPGLRGSLSTYSKVWGGDKNTSSPAFLTPKNK